MKDWWRFAVCLCSFPPETRCGPIGIAFEWRKSAYSRLFRRLSRSRHASRTGARSALTHGKCKKTNRAVRFFTIAAIRIRFGDSFAARSAYFLPLGRFHRRPLRLDCVAAVKLRFALQLDHGRRGAVIEGGGRVGALSTSEGSSVVHSADLRVAATVTCATGKVCWRGRVPEMDRVCFFRTEPISH